MMSKKDYEKIAKILSQAKREMLIDALYHKPYNYVQARAYIDNIQVMLMNAFQYDNVKFDRGKFIATARPGRVQED